MSWLDEDYTEADAAQNSLKAVNRRIANKWYDTFPSDDEGSEGEVRNVYVNGTPLTAVKMNGSWHFQVLNTMGQEGTMRTDEGGISGDFNAFMPNEPTLDTGFKYMLNKYPEDYTDANIDKLWPCVYTGDDGNNWEPSFYILHHGLGLSRPPKNIKTYVANLSDGGLESGMAETDTMGNPGTNCLIEPYPTTGACIWDGIQTILMMRMGAFQLLTSQGVTFTVPPYNGENVGTVNQTGHVGNLKSILTNIEGTGQTSAISDLDPNNWWGFDVSPNLAVAIISPNHLLFSPMWQGSYDAGGSYQFMEWARFMIWR